MKEITYTDYVVPFLNQLPQGAFLTVKSGDKTNTMTIGWGTIGHIWNKPVLSVLVRYSRYTYELIKNAADFTVSVPLNKELQRALALAGTRSGRETDKFRECQLSAAPSPKVNSPYIGECGLIYECKIVFRQKMEAEYLNKDLREKFYKDDDWHEIFYGEIVGCYLAE